MLVSAADGDFETMMVRPKERLENHTLKAPEKLSKNPLTWGASLPLDDLGIASKRQ
jgi:hypothetical protein